MSLPDKITTHRRPRAELSLLIDGVQAAPFALPRHSVADIGRSLTSAIRLAPRWAPRLLAQFSPVEDGWILTNGGRTRLWARSPTVRIACFERGARVMLQPGTWTLRWDLDGPCAANVRITSVPAGYREPLPYALNDRLVSDSVAVQTLVAGAQVSLSARMRHQLAVLFAHEFDDEPAPDNLCKAAAGRLGVSEPQVKRTAFAARDRLNRDRGRPIESLEELGYYLVHVAQVLSPDDLTP